MLAWQSRVRHEASNACLDLMTQLLVLRRVMQQSQGNEVREVLLETIHTQDPSVEHTARTLQWIRTLATRLLSGAMG